MGLLIRPASRREKMIGKKEHRALKPDAQAFDEVRITTVPRYKTSGLSGDEWRISAHIEFLRNGVVQYTERSRNVKTACRLFAWYHITAIEKGNGRFAGEDDICDQEGCPEKAAVTYRKKQRWCSSCGKAHDPHVIDIRKFCARHSTRGDCGLDDADANYELVEGNPTAPNSDDESPSIFGGIIKL